jgi:hypothetical protein
LHDLPWQGSTVVLRVDVRRFRCRTHDCPRVTFAEALPLVCPRYGRQTSRLSETVRLIGYVLGGEAGARLSGRGVRHGRGSSLCFFFLCYVSECYRSLRKDSRPCPIPCLLSKLNAPISCARSALLVTCGQARYPRSFVDAANRPAIAPSPMIPATTPKSVSRAPSMARR